MTSELRLSGRRIQVFGVTGAGTSRAGGALSEDDARHSVQALVESKDEWILDGKYVIAVRVKD
ncbi:hypothetical protein F5Y19DRAFT_478522 [Xylariaceae sp. FL1651]|nr:hypothetical protein F5Y19DRAFT_478522 [Xylariaceae sp. FL1651]